MTWNSRFLTQVWLLLHKILLLYDNTTILAHVFLLSLLIALVTLRWQCMPVQELYSAGTALVRWHHQALVWLVKSFLTAFHLENQVFNLHHEGGGVYPLSNMSLFLQKCWCAGSSKLPSSFLFYFLLLQNYSDCSKPSPSPRMLTGDGDLT